MATARFRRGRRLRRVIPQSVAIADLDGDGAADLVTANFNSDNVSVLLGKASSGALRRGPPGDFSTLRRNDDNTFTRFFKDGGRDEFSAAGLHIRSIEPDGRTTSYAYDSSDRLERITDPAGRVTRIRYAGSRIDEIEDPAGRITRFVHDAAGNLIRIVNPDGTTREFSYDSRHLLLSQTDERGQTTSYSYDGTGRVIASTLPDGTGRSSASSSTAALVDDPDSTSATNPAPAVPAADVSSGFIDGNGNLLAFKTGALGTITERTDALLRTTTIDRNADGLPTRIVRPNGAVERRSYNASGNVTELVLEDINATTTLAYDDRFSKPSSIRDPNGNETALTYDEAGNLVTVTEPDGTTTAFAYDDPDCPGQPTGITRAQGTTVEATSSISYDATTCNATEFVDALGRVTTRDYDAVGNLIRSTDPEGRVTRFDYDAMNRLTRRIAPSNSDPDPSCGTADVTCFEYDAAGNLTAVIDGNNQVTSFAYDALDRLVERTDPLGAVDTFSYDANDNVIATTNRKGQTITFSYDAANRPLEKTWQPGTPEEEVTTFTFNDIDRLTQVIDPDSQVNRSYDPIGRLISESTNGSPSQPGVELTYSYDANSNRLTLAGPLDTISYAYDVRNQLTQLTAPFGTNLGFSYDARGRRTEISRPNGVTSTAVIDAANQLQTLVHQLDSAPGPFTQFDYTYDGAGNRTQRAQTREVPEVKTALNYVYDAKEQLVQATRPFLGEPDETFTYDPVGNRLNRDGQSGDSIFDAANRLLEDGEFCYAYDANGNLVSKQAKLSGSCSGTLTEYRYNPEDQMVEVIVDGTTTAEYAYDGLGRRIQKVTPAATMRYIYDDQDIYLEYDGSDTLVARYTHGLNIDEPLIMERDLDASGTFEASERFYYHTDALGSITELTEQHRRCRPGICLRQLRQHRGNRWNGDTD